MPGSRPDSRIVFALDFRSIDEARAMALRLRELVGMFKVGLELFVQAGPQAVAIGKEADRPIFLDLKLCDIPATVEGAVARASSVGAHVVTVHASGGKEMLRRAVERADKDGAGLQVAAVTVLTSLDAQDLAAVGVHASVGEQVQRLARLAWSEGVRSFVCSACEAAALRATLGADATLITPGVRGPGETVDDQKRTMTARAAIAAGADWVVVGRPIRDASDPVSAARAIAREIDAARGGG